MNKEKFIEIINNQKMQRLLAVIIIVLVNVFGLSKQYAITIIDDEFGYVAAGAQMAGYDWTTLLGTSYYYSYGLGIIYSLFFRMGISGRIFLPTIIIFNIILLILTYIIVSYLATKIVSDKWGSWIALAINLYTSNIFHCKLAWSETLLYFLTWLLVLLIYRFNQDFKLKYLISMILIVSYMYMIHQRCLSVIIAVVILMVVILLNGNLNKENILKCVCSLWVLCALIIISTIIKNYVIENWYGTQSVEETRIAVNDYTNQISKIKKLKDIEYLLYLFLGLIGKLWAQATASFMMILFAGVVCISTVFKNIKNKIRRINEEEIFLFSATLFFMGSLGVASLYKLNTLENQRYYEIIMTRYIDYVAGPIILCGYNIVLNLKKYMKEIVFSFVLMIAMTVITWLQFELSSQKLITAVNVASVYSWVKRAGDNPNVILWVGFILLACVMGMLICLHRGVCRKKADIGIVIMLFLLVGFYSYNGIKLTDSFTGYKQQEVVDYVKPVVEYIEDREWNGTIYYVQCEDDGGYNFLKILQYLLPEQNIELIFQEDVEKILLADGECIFLCRTDYEGESDWNLLDDNFVMDTGRLGVYSCKK